jgi:hypothetical protein
MANAVAGLPVIDIRPLDVFTGNYIELTFKTIQDIVENPETE